MIRDLVPPSGRRRRAHKAWRVLLAEHDQRSRKALAALLRQEDCQVIEARSSDDFLDLLVEASLPHDDARRPYDLIVSDLIMPGGRGLEALQAFGKPLSAIPVVLISAVLDADLKRRAYQLGALAVLRKPFGVQEVRAALGSALSVNFRVKHGP